MIVNELSKKATYAYSDALLSTQISNATEF